MSFDFYGEYKDYPNLELLKIMRQPDHYQSEAIAAASQILGERQMAAGELLSLDQTLQELDEAEKKKIERIDRLKTTATELFSPILQPRETIEPSKWLNLLLLVIVFQYAWTLFEIAKKLIRIFTRGAYFWIDFIDILPIFYVPVILYLLFKRRRWGWILLFADTFSSLIMLLTQTPIFFKYQPIHHGSTVSFITTILLRLAFAFFLWRDAIAEHFGVNTKTKKRTAMITAGSTLIYSAVLYVLFR